MIALLEGCKGGCYVFLFLFCLKKYGEGVDGGLMVFEGMRV